MIEARPTRATYFWTAGVLLALLGLTLLMSELRLGAAAPAVALLIAGVKAALVALFFMHLKFDRPVTRLFAATGIIWLVLLIGGTLTDYLSRGWIG